MTKQLHTKHLLSKRDKVRFFALTTKIICSMPNFWYQKEAYQTMISEFLSLEMNDLITGTYAERIINTLVNFNVRVGA